MEKIPTPQTQEEIMAEQDRLFQEFVAKGREALKNGLPLPAAEFIEKAESLPVVKPFAASANSMKKPPEEPAVLRDPDSSKWTAAQWRKAREEEAIRKLSGRDPLEY